MRNKEIVFALAATMLIAATAGATPVSVSVKNLAPANGVNFTPVWVGFHDGSFDLFNLGAAAGAALERLAEDGNPAPLDSQFQTATSNGVSGVIFSPPDPPVFAPGDQAKISFELDPVDNRYFSFASMIIPSNDAFIGNGNPTAYEIFDNNGTFSKANFYIWGADVYDAGTEVNDEIPENTAFLGQTVADTGVDENGVVTWHLGFIPGGNVLTAFAGADFTEEEYPIAKFTIDTAPIPEPMSLLLFGTGLAGFASLKKRRKIK